MKVSTSPRSIPLVIWTAVLAVIVTVSIAPAGAWGYPPLKPGVVKVDTGNLAEDEQPPWTERLARHGWDYNPKCDKQGARFDWFAPGQPCNERPLPPILGTIGRGRGAA